MITNEVRNNLIEQAMFWPDQSRLLGGLKLDSYCVKR